MQIHPKPPEVIQAQIADFAHSGGEQGKGLNTGGQEYVFDNIGRLAAGSVVDVHYIDPVDQSIADKIGGSDLGRISLPDRAITASDYVEHLRETRGSRNPRVQQRVAYLRAYNDFLPNVGDLVKDVAGVGREARRAIDAYLGSGQEVAAFAVVHNQKEYVLKVGHGLRVDAGQADGYVKDLERGKSIPHLEQLAAISYEHGVVITERMPGTPLSSMSLEAAELITPEQILEALHTMRAAHDAGILFDPKKPGNYFYDPAMGFGFIDYRSASNANTQTYADKVSDFAANLATVGGQQLLLTTREDYLLRAERDLHRIPLLQKCRAVYAAQENPEDYVDAITQIDRMIAAKQAFVTRAHTPGWIENELAAQAQLLRERREDSEQMKRDLAAGIPDLVD